MARLKLGKVLLHLYLTEENKQDLDRLQKQLNADSLSEVFRRALSLYYFVIQEREKGSVFQIKRTGERAKEVEFL